jgi:anti-anti-sigma factor
VRNDVDNNEEHSLLGANMITINQVHDNGVSVFSLDGRIDVSGVEDVASALQKAFQSGSTRVVLDMSRVNYINGRGLHLLTRTRQENLAEGGDLRLVSVSPLVEHVMSIAGVDSWFPKYDSIAQALNF